MLAAAVAAGVYLLADPPSADLAAQAFRAGLFEREGFTVFSTAWYGGHHTPGYSVLFPPLAAWLGPQLVGALSAVAATAAVGALAGRTVALLAVPGLIATLVSGRLTFALGCAFGAAGVLAAARGRPALSALGGVLTALSSPVAALFAALAGAALTTPGVRPRAFGSPRNDLSGVRPRTVVTDRTSARGLTPSAPRAGVEGGGGLTPATRSAGVALGVGAVVPVVLLVVAFPEGGTFPFAVSAFLPAFVAGVAVAVAAPSGPLRTAGALYALLCLAALALPTPVGGNATRLGTLVAAPVAFWLLWPHRRLALALLALPIAYWVLQPAVRDVRRASGDPSTGAAFHRPLVDFLRERGDARRLRIEIPLTQNHGEAWFIAPHVALARGWERQVDRDRNALFYADEPLTPAAYAAWLREQAVAYVALPEGVPMDPAGEDERALLLAGQPFLSEIGRPRGWRVWAVRGARPLADGAARLTELRPDGFVLQVQRRGAVTVRVRHTPYWALLRGRGCVEPAPGGWTRVRAEEMGPIEVGTRFSPGRVRASSPRCR